MFAYKTAVAIKKLGFRNVRIYNGGLKDWKKSGNAISSLEPLPTYKGKFINADELLSRMKKAEAKLIEKNAKQLQRFKDLKDAHDNCILELKKLAPEIDLSQMKLEHFANSKMFPFDTGMFCHQPFIAIFKTHPSF